LTLSLNRVIYIERLAKLPCEIEAGIMTTVSLPVVRPQARFARRAGVVAAGVLVLAVLIWQAVTSAGNPNPTAEGISPTAMTLNTSIIVFREGLEAILILAALTASLVRTEGGYWKPVALGAGLSFLASVATWFVVVALISSINAPALHVQAATGLLAIVVLLVIMNWFFHNVYWAGWITMHNRRKKNLTESSDRSQSAVFRGLMLLGFTAVYREGFEIVLFLQSMRLRGGSHVVLGGVTIGVALTLIVALLTFVAHAKLPYKKMLVLTGIMLSAVLMVMVGEQVQEMQQAGWVSMTELPLPIPGWMGMWFAAFPNIEGLGAQALAGSFVIGSYYLARRVCARSAQQSAPGTAMVCVVPDCENCDMGKESNVSTFREG
jgi:high-affinity iron transporter